MSNKLRSLVKTNGEASEHTSIGNYSGENDDTIGRVRERAVAFPTIY